MGASAPTQTQSKGTGNPMSTSYGEPIELFLVDPNSGAETEFADTTTNGTVNVSSME